MANTKNESVSIQLSGEREFKKLKKEAVGLFKYLHKQVSDVLRAKGIEIDMVAFKKLTQRYLKKLEKHNPSLDIKYDYDGDDSLEPIINDYCFDLQEEILSGLEDSAVDEIIREIERLRFHASITREASQEANLLEVFYAINHFRQTIANTFAKFKLEVITEPERRVAIRLNTTELASLLEGTELDVDDESTNAVNALNLINLIYRVVPGNIEDMETHPYLKLNVKTQKEYPTNLEILNAIKDLLPKPQASKILLNP